MRVALTLSVFMIAAMIAISIFGWFAIPENTMIATHWNLAGEADGFSRRDHILFGMPLLAIALTLLFAFIPQIEPRRAHAAFNTGLLNASWLGATAVMLIAHGAIVLSALGQGSAATHMPQAILFAVAALLMLVGNFTAKSRSNFFLGVRTPWTLSSEHAWSAANRAAGWMFVLSGAAAMAAGLFIDTATGFKVLIASILGTVVMSVVISYMAWRKDPERGAS